VADAAVLQTYIKRKKSKNPPFNSITQGCPNKIRFLKIFSFATSVNDTDGAP
jgi:hypothetical protein